MTPPKLLHSPLRTLPKVEPIVPVARPAPFNDPAWLFEPKYDGFRGLVCLTRQACSIYSKRGACYTVERGRRVWPSCIAVGSSVDQGEERHPTSKETA